MRMKLLIYGGSFDPPHLGHELLLQKAVEAIKPNRVLVIPTAQPPHKRTPGVSFADRCAMCATFRKSASDVRVLPIENIDRRERSYTAKTLARLKKQYRNWDFYYLIGGDMLLSFKRWHRPFRILSQTALVAAARENEYKELEAAARELRRSGARVSLLSFEPVEISSTEIRNAVSAGNDVSAYLSESVKNYIKGRNLYR